VSERAATARELVDEINRLFAETDFRQIRDSLEGRMSAAQADEVLGDFSRFVRRAVDPEVVIDFTATELPADYRSVFHGWRGWLEFWRLWFEPWQEQRSSTNEVEELDAGRALQHAVTHNRGRGSGVEVRWEGWNLWVARQGRIVRFEQYASREEALVAAGRHRE
jgi:hypothetical protein